MMMMIIIIIITLVHYYCYIIIIIITLAGRPAKWSGCLLRRRTRSHACERHTTKQLMYISSRTRCVERVDYGPPVA